MPLIDEADDIEISSRVRSAVVALLWGPVVIVLYAIALTPVAMLYRYAIHGEPPILFGIAESLDPTATGGMLLAVAVGIAGLYYLLAHVTFGAETVQTAQEGAQELAEDMQ